MTTRPACLPVGVVGIELVIDASATAVAVNTPNSRIETNQMNYHYNARRLIDAYAAVDPADGDYGPNFRRDRAAPEAIAALRAVLALRPPTLDDEDNETEHALLDDGWWTCHTSVVNAIAAALNKAKPARPKN